MPTNIQELIRKNNLTNSQGQPIKMAEPVVDTQHKSLEDLLEELLFEVEYKLKTDSRSISQLSKDSGISRAIISQLQRDVKDLNHIRVDTLRRLIEA